MASKTGCIFHSAYMTSRNRNQRQPERRLLGFFRLGLGLGFFLNSLWFGLVFWLGLQLFFHILDGFQQLRVLEGGGLLLARNIAIAAVPLEFADLIEREFDLVPFAGGDAPLISLLGLRTAVNVFAAGTMIGGRRQLQSALAVFQFHDILNTPLPPRAFANHDCTIVVHCSD